MNAFSESNRRVVITGMGIFSPIGIGSDEFKKNVLAGTSGVGKLTLLSGTACPDDIGGEVTAFNQDTIKKQYLKEKEQKKSIKVMCREIQMGAAAALQALEHAGIDMQKMQRERVGIDFGAHLMCSPPEDLSSGCYACTEEPSLAFHFETWGVEGLKKMDPLWLLRYLPNMPACHIAIFTDARGPSNSLTHDEAAANLAMSEATRILLRGDADVMITGSTGTRVHAVRSIHTAMFDELATGPLEASARSRPFDRDRTGQVPAEAATSIILEDESHAIGRGAKIYGRILGTGSSCVMSKVQAGDIRKALSNAMIRALRTAGLQPGDIGHINANGVGSVAADLAEAQAIHDVFGEFGSKIPVTAIKSLTGNSGSGCGGVELSASLLALEQGLIPPTINCDHPDATCNLTIVRGEPMPTNNKIVMNLNVTRMGQASVVIVEAA